MNYDYILGGSNMALKWGPYIQIKIDNLNKKFKNYD